jgi:hypothetical protein
MLSDIASPAQVDDFANKLACATRASAALFTQISASPRLATLKAIGKARRLDRLLECEAWTEAALELISLEAPGWKVKRLCRDDGEWLCTLTRFPDLPDWLDDSAEGRHSVLALAVLEAFLSVRVQTSTSVPSTLRHQPDASADCADYR